MTGTISVKTTGRELDSRDTIGSYGQSDKQSLFELDTSNSLSSGATSDNS